MKTKEALKKISALASLKPVAVMERPKFHVKEDGSSTINDFNLDVSVTNSVFDKLGIASKYLECLRKETLENVVQDLWPSRGFMALSDGKNNVMALADKANFHKVNPEQILSEVEQFTKDYSVQRALLMPNFSVTMEVVATEQKPVAKGDLVRGGIMAEFSPVGTINPRVWAYTSRLACTNGAIATDVIHTFSYSGNGNDEEFAGWLKDAVAKALKGFDSILVQYKAMAGSAINSEQRANILNYLLHETELGRAANRAVRAKAINEPPENMWDMFNLVSWATTHVIEDPDRIFGSMLRIGNMAGEHEMHGICPFCNKVVEN